ncbi:MAG: 16S rRNA (guanine(966)-N(2))-methyltransferase RsmD [Desulfobacterales bacterium]|nr:16S rRNA (guanine(966)-N(2))-methyltransferase RsmD [Desulfobacterales bacterium]
MGLRIIAGELRGRRLAAVPGLSTRPTADRTRESIFNILGETVRGAQVLDLFAGTGAYGIEALSRGAATAVFVDIAGPALKVLAANLAACRLEARARVIRWDAGRDLNCLRSGAALFQLVFIDPPYHAGLVAPALRNLESARCLAPGARIVVEQAGDAPLIAAAAFALRDERRYGKTRVSFLVWGAS